MKNHKRIALIIILFGVAALILPIAGCSPQGAENKPENPQQSAEDKLFENNVKYSAFGAVGDGKTDDFKAIKAAHEYANENGVAVKADEGAKYYIGAVEDTVTVKTNVDWSGAEFIIDDESAETESNVWRYPLFTVKSESAPKNVDIPQGYSLKAGQKNLGMSFDKTYMLALYNSEKKDFIRLNNTDNKGYIRQEIILADENGNADETTPVQWDYEKVTEIKAYSIDDAPIMLRGGKFTTIANDDPYIRYYFERGIMVERSNVTVRNVSHFVTDEGETGSPYNGFFRAKFANNVVFENCEMTGHKYYSQGTYDTRLISSNNVRYLNCTQTNDHTDPTFWGVMCSDFCKNLYMDGCRLSRFDAHMGVYNATIVNSDIGQNISVVGGGLLRVENVIKRCAKGTYFNRFVTLREDYGSFFYGDVVIKDSTLITGRGINYVIAASWYDWDFGYECRFPTTVTLDNVRYKYEDVSDSYLHPHLFIFSHTTENEEYTPEFAKASKNPPVLPEKVIIRNNETTFKLTANTFGWYSETQVEYV